MKLSKAQQTVMEHLNKTLAVVDKYETFEEFFDNSKCEQNTFTTGCHCNCLYNTSEKYESKDPIKFNEMRKDFYKAKNDRILIAIAKTETINVLERNGLIKVIEPAEYNGGAEIVKVL